MGFPALPLRHSALAVRFNPQDTKALWSAKAVYTILRKRLINFEKKLDFCTALGYGLKPPQTGDQFNELIARPVLKDIQQIINLLVKDKFSVD